jgi:hypothetical protein
MFAGAAVKCFSAGKPRLCLVCNVKNACAGHKAYGEVELVENNCRTSVHVMVQTWHATCGVIVSEDTPEAHVPCAVLFALQSDVPFKQAMN